MVICDQTGTACQHGNDCLLRGVCRLIPNNGLGNLIASQPYSTNQEPAAPSLERLAEGDVDNNIRREIRVFNAGDGWTWAYYNDPLPPYLPMNNFADKKAAMRSARRFVESVSKSTILYLHGDGIDAYWKRA